MSSLDAIGLDLLPCSPSARRKGLNGGNILLEKNNTQRLSPVPQSISETEDYIQGGRVTADFKQKPWLFSSLPTLLFFHRVWKSMMHGSRIGLLSIDCVSLDDGGSSLPVSPHLYYRHFIITFLSELMKIWDFHFRNTVTDSQGPFWMKHLQLYSQLHTLSEAVRDGHPKPIFFTTSIVVPRKTDTESSLGQDLSYIFLYVPFP